MLQIEAVPAYAEHLRREPSEGDALFRELLIGVTQFFRDEDSFEALKANFESDGRPNRLDPHCVDADERRKLGFDELVQREEGCATPGFLTRHANSGSPNEHAWLIS